ncbi:MAG: beta-lactamase family protein [Ignavibacteria bacterium]|nr:beta-lactamase family protein [Ignavibacteria bacterium]
MKNYFLFLFILFLSSGHLYSQNNEMVVPADGAYVPELSSFDNGMVSFMKKYKIPGGQLSVMKNGKIVYSRAFGYSDLKKSIPVKTTDLMRIASNSKPITGVAILKLIEEGRLKYDDKAFDILSNLTPPPGRTVIDKEFMT